MNALLFTIEAAEMAKTYIDDGYQQAKAQFQRSAKESNPYRKQYWKERIIHFMGESNRVEQLILQITYSKSNPE